MIEELALNMKPGKRRYNRKERAKWIIPRDKLCDSWEQIYAAMPSKEPIGEKGFARIVRDTYIYFHKHIAEKIKPQVEPEDLRLYRYICRVADIKPDSFNMDSRECLFSACKAAAESLIWCIEHGFPRGYYLHMMPSPVRDWESGAYELDMDTQTAFDRGFHELVKWYRGKAGYPETDEETEKPQTDPEDIFRSFFGSEYEKMIGDEIKNGRRSTGREDWPF